MPLIQLTTSSDLAENSEIPEILASLTRALSSFDSIDSASVKAYHFLIANWAMGEGAAPGFANVQVMILAGRPESVRTEISDRMYTLLKTQFAESLEHGLVNLTFELREMDRAGFRK